MVSVERWKFVVGMGVSLSSSSQSNFEQVIGVRSRSVEAPEQGMGPYPWALVAFASSFSQILILESRHSVPEVTSFVTLGRLGVQFPAA